MSYLEELNKKIAKAQEECAQEKKILSTIESLRTQRSQLRDVQFQAELQLQKEEADVEALKIMSFKRFLSQLKGDREERLEQEEREVVTAKLQYDRATRDFKDVEADLLQAQHDLNQTRSQKTQLTLLLKEKTDYLVSQGGETGAKLGEIEAQISQHQQMLQEVKEAVMAGNRVVSTISQMEKELQSAGNWGTFDMLGGGLVATMVKHDHMDQAQNLSDQLSREISKFRSELADVSCQLDAPQVGIDGFSRMGDYLFDGFFMDIFVQNKINRAQEDTTSIRMKAEQTIRQLQTMENKLRREISELEQERQQLLGMM